ncbi:MAG TPA: hypothetical protein VE567_06625 [Sphingomonas sp.]|nr:hypothetical protein [Sphingomonas sp.]
MTEIDGSLEFGRFRVLVPRRQMLASGVAVELGTRAFDLLMALIEANGSVVSESELMTRRTSGRDAGCPGRSTNGRDGGSGAHCVPLKCKSQAF